MDLFFGPSAIRVGRELSGGAYTVISRNNRGHRFGTMLRRFRPIARPGTDEQVAD